MYDMTALTHATSLAHGFRIQTTTQSLVYPIPASVYRRRRILVAAVLSTVVFFGLFLLPNASFELPDASNRKLNT